MSISTIIGYAISLSIALLAGLVGVYVLGVLIDASSRFRGRLFALIFPMIGIAIAISSLLSGRNLSYGEFLVMTGAVEPALTRWLLRAMTLVVLAASVAVFVTYVLDRRHERPAGAALLTAFVIFFFCNTVLNSIFGAKPTFIHNLVYPLFVMVGAYAVRGYDIATSIKAVKITVLALLVVSCVAAVAAPDVAIQRPYNGWIPGINFRFWGVGSNANSIGPLALLYLLLAAHQPFKRRWLQWSGLGVAFAVLLLAQSKTAFVAAFAALVILWAYRVWEQLGTAYAHGTAPLQLSGIMLGSLALGVGLLAAVTIFDAWVLVERFLESKAGRQALTLTGRTVLWDIALREWERNPMFGFGPTIWDPEFRRTIGLVHAFSAHNQFMQSLGSAGTMGLIGLCVYLAVMSVFAVRAVSASRGFSVALLVVILLRCLSEAPLTTSTVFNADFLTHLLLFMVVLGFGPGRGTERSGSTASVPLSATARA